MSLTPHPPPACTLLPSFRSIYTMCWKNRDSTHRVWHSRLWHRLRKTEIRNLFGCMESAGSGMRKCTKIAALVNGAINKDTKRLRLLEYECELTMQPIIRHYCFYGKLNSSFRIQIGRK